jgi:tetratricopeptide (TPR) repeat protein
MIKTTLHFCLLCFLLAACAAPTARTAAPTAPPKIQDVGPAVQPEPPTLAELLKQIESAYRQGNYTLGLALVKKAFELNSNDVSSMDRIGSIYYVLGRYGEALTIWGKALPLEKDAQKRRALENSIVVARRELGLADEAFVSAATTSAASAPPRPAAPAPKALSAEAREHEVQALYKKGVKYYASGEYLQATTAFLRILELDPGNPDAEKALKRLKLDQ